MSLSRRTASAIAIFGCIAGMSATTPAAAQRLAANHPQAERGAPMQSAPMRMAPRAAPVREPRYLAPRYFAPRAVVPRVRWRRASVPRDDAPRVREPAHPSPVEVRRPAAPPTALPAGIAAPRFAAGVPVPQLRRGVPSAKFTHVPAPNFPGPQATVHSGGTAAMTRPGHGPVAGFVKIHRRNVSIIRGARFVRLNGRWRRIVPVTVLLAPAAVLVVGGASYFADGYVDMPGPTCGGVTDSGCQLSMASIPTNDGDTVPQCVQYCAWDNGSDSTAAAPAAEPAVMEGAAAEPAPPPALAAAATRPAADPVSLAVTPEAPVNYAQTYAINIQGAPEAGGKCVGVPNRPIAQGMALQIGACGGVSAQTFSYDSADKRLTISGLCVDTADGTAKAGDPLRLAPCNGRPSQTWYIRQNAAYVEFVGINGLCIDTQNAATQDHTPLIAATCHGQASQSWTMHAAFRAAAK